MTSKYTVVIPAYNEDRTIGLIIDQINSVCPDCIDSIIVVDDGSTDKTAEVARAAGAFVIKHRFNIGYGASLKTGIRNAKSPYIIIMDADGQHDPADLPKFLQLADENDMVVGVRKGLFHSPLWRTPGKWFINWLANYLSKTKIPDLTCGFRLFRKEVIIKYLHLCPDGFSFSTTSTLVLINRRYNITFIPINARKRRENQSSVTVKTGFDTILLILRLIMLFNPLRIFLPISFLCLIGGFVLGVYYFIHGSGVVGTALILIMTGILLFFFGLLADQITELRKERFE
nr:glycosyltransferase family 2 protein [uncultured Methanoregula sp.]